MTKPPDELKFGAHEARFEPPDTLVASFSGPISMDEAVRAAQLYKETYERRGQYYFVCDIGRSQIEAASRQYISSHIKGEWFHGVIYVGADILQRTFGKAIALALLFTSKPGFETVFVPTMAEAYAWIAQHRGYRQRKAG